jgi:enolase
MKSIPKGKGCANRAGDEDGYSPQVMSNEEARELLVQAVRYP